MAPSTGLLTIGIGVLAMGLTAFVTIVGAIRMVPRNWVKLDCSSPKPWVLGEEPVMEREESHCPPPFPLPVNASSPFVPPSTPSLALFVFLSESSSLLSPPPPFPLAELNSEGEEEREERATGWNPCCSKKKQENEQNSCSFSSLIHKRTDT